MFSYQLKIAQNAEGKYTAGIDAPGAYQATGATPLVAIRNWMHVIGSGVVKYQRFDISLEYLAERIGIAEEDALALAECETFLPPPSMVSSISPRDQN